MTKGSTRRRARAEGAHHVETAERLSKAGKYAEALASMMNAARLIPDDADVLGRLGRAYLMTGRLRQAIDALRRSLALRPGVGEVHNDLSIAHSAIGEDDAAIAACREAIRLNPDFAETHGRLGELLFAKGMRSEAAAAYERASALEPTQSVGRFRGVMAHFAMNRLKEAEEGFRQIVADEPSNGRALQLLGLVLQIRGDHGEAARVYERAIEADPLNAWAYHGLANSRKFTEVDRPLAEKIVLLLGRDDWHRKLAPADVERRRMSLSFSAGKIHDDLGEYAQAIQHFDAANRIRRRLQPFNRDVLKGRVDGLISRFTPEFFANHRAIGGDDRTPILLVGLPRSGTSLLERILSNHPEVRGRGELAYWNDRGPSWFEAEPAALAKAAPELRAGYVNLLRNGDTQVARATDKMPFNYLWVGLVHLLFPNAVFVYCRRNPVDTCLSIYMTQFATVPAFSNSFEDLVIYHRHFSRLMDHWRAVIPSDRYIEIDYEDVARVPEKTARSLLAFCGLDWDPACLHPERNREAIATASHWQARQPIYRSSLERWRHYEPWLGELRSLLGES
jgi:tetratricopeptide (TPR) repeat protein